MQSRSAARQLADRLQDTAVLVGPGEHVVHVVSDVQFAPGGGVVTQRYQTAAVVIASQVQHDRAEVRRRPVDRRDPAGVASEAEERLLYEVLRRILVVDEESGQPHEGPSLELEELHHEALSLQRDRFALEAGVGDGRREQDGGTLPQREQRHTPLRAGSSRQPIIGWPEGVSVDERASAHATDERDRRLGDIEIVMVRRSPARAAEPSVHA